MFLPWEILLIKKLEIDKTKTTLYTTFKTDITKKVLVFSISNFLLTKTPREEKCVREKKCLREFGFSPLKLIIYPDHFALETLNLVINSPYNMKHL